MARQTAATQYPPVVTGCPSRRATFGYESKPILGALLGRDGSDEVTACYSCSRPAHQQLEGRSALSPPLSSVELLVSLSLKERLLF